MAILKYFSKTEDGFSESFGVEGLKRKVSNKQLMGGRPED